MTSLPALFPAVEDAQILNIQVQLGGVKCLALADTGSGAYLVGKPWLETAQDIKWVTQHQNFAVEGAKAGEILTLLGTIEADLKLGDKVIRIQAIATPDLHRHLVLSWGLLKARGAKIEDGCVNFAKLQVSVPECAPVQFNLLSVSSDVRDVTLARHISNFIKHYTPTPVRRETNPTGRTHGRTTPQPFSITNSSYIYFIST